MKAEYSTSLNNMEYAYMKFNFSSLVNIQITSAILQMTSVHSSNEFSFLLYLVSNDWEEDAVTFLTIPQNISLLGSFEVSKDQLQVICDITDSLTQVFANGQTEISLGVFLSANSSHSFEFYSRKFSNQSVIPSFHVSGNVDVTQSLKSPGIFGSLSVQVAAEILCAGFIVFSMACGIGILVCCKCGVKRRNVNRAAPIIVNPQIMGSDAIQRVPTLICPACKIAWPSTSRVCGACHALLSRK